MRDFLLLNLKQAHQQKPWNHMPENEQKLWIERIESRAERLVQDVIDRVSTGAFPVVHAKIDNFKVKGGEITITAKGFADDLVLLTLNHAGPKAVKIIVADGEQFDQERDQLNPDPDQPGLPGVRAGEPGFDDDDDPAPEPEIENPPGESEEGEEILTPKSDQWRGGFNSRMGAHERHDCPFKESTPECIAWLEGWDVANMNVMAPKLDGKAIGKVIADSDVQIDGDGEVQPEEPAPEPKLEKPKRTPKPKAKAPLVEPDIAPEGEVQPEPPVETNDPVSVIPTNQDDEPIETTDQAYAFGRWSRSDGRGTGGNPFPVTSDMGKAWLRGYSAQRQEEAKDDGF